MDGHTASSRAPFGGLCHQFCRKAGLVKGNKIEFVCWLGNGLIKGWQVNDEVRSKCQIVSSPFARDMGFEMSCGKPGGLQIYPCP